MCYPASSQFWALPQPELKHKSEENYPDSKNKFFCRSFFFSSCGQYCSRPCNPIPSLQLTIWWAYFSSVTQQKPLLFFFSGWDFYWLSNLNQLLKSQRRTKERRKEMRRWRKTGYPHFSIQPYSKYWAYYWIEYTDSEFDQCSMHYLFCFHLQFLFHYFWSSHLEQMLVGISAKDKQYRQWKAGSLLKLQRFFWWYENVSKLWSCLTVRKGMGTGLYLSSLPFPYNHSQKLMYVLN